MEQAQKDFLMTLAAFFLRHRRASDALILVEALMRLLPQDREVMKQLAYARLLTRDFQGALAAIRQWDEKHDGGDDIPSIHLLRSQVLRGCGQHEDAQQALQSYRQQLARRTAS